MKEKEEAPKKALEALFDSPKPSKGNRAKVAVKYKSGTNGGKLEDLLVK